MSSVWDKGGWGVRCKRVEVRKFMVVYILNDSTQNYVYPVGICLDTDTSLIHHCVQGVTARLYGGYR
jgi:hypothetical protein